MQRYTVTIAPEDPGGAQTTLKVEVDAGGPRITEVTMRAGVRSQLAAANIAAIDFDLLLRAVMPPAIPAPRSPDDRVAARPGVTAERAAPAARSATGRRARTTGTAGRRADEGPSTKQARVYRPMPDDFVSRYGGETMAQLADVYAVPMHTVKAWIHTARKQGRIPPSQLRRSRSAT